MTHSTQNRSRPHILVVTVSLIAACLLLTTASWAAANPPMPAMPRTSGGEPRGVFTGLIASPLAKPHPVVGADGRSHLVYELQLINSTSAAVTVTKVETVDPATGRVLATSMGTPLLRSCSRSALRLDRRWAPVAPVSS